LVTKPKEKDEWESKLFGKKGKQNKLNSFNDWRKIKIFD